MLALEHIVDQLVINHQDSSLAKCPHQGTPSPMHYHSPLLIRKVSTNRSRQG